MIRTLVAFLIGAQAALAEPIVVQSTTSTQNAGLFDAIIPQFSQATGLDVRIVAVGTGQALKNAQNCDGDLLIVHARAAEETFISAGYGTARADLMFNDFVIVGPMDDPAGLGAYARASDALIKVWVENARFASRGDDSGTHQAEMRLWDEAGVDPQPDSGDWYLETGAGMGATLNTAVGLGAYTLTDRATWVRFANKRGFDVIVEGDPALFNQYGVVTLNPDHCPNANHDGATRLWDWLLSDTGQTAIAAYQVDGKQLFFPNATP